jgi:aminomethyltransferase
MERGVPRHGYILGHEGKAVGTVTGGTFSPCLHKGIAMGYAPPSLAKEGTVLDVMIREKAVRAQVVRAPFYRKG